MSDIADALIAIVETTPEDKKAEVKAICSQIMRHSMQLDLLTKQSVQLMLDEHASEVAKLKAEIASYDELLESAEIRTALAKLCKRHRVNPGIVERLTPFCQMGYRELVILDCHGLPTTFEDGRISPPHFAFISRHVKSR